MTTIHRRQAKTWPNPVPGPGNQIGAARKNPSISPPCFLHSLAALFDHALGLSRPGVADA